MLITSGRVHPVARGKKISGNSAPVWQSAPTVPFVFGVASVFPTSGTYQSNGYVTDVDGQTITITWGGSISGVTWDGGKFSYDGVGAVTSSSQTLSATDGVDTVASPSFSVDIASSVAWSSNPAPSFTAGVTGETFNVSSYLVNYNAGTDVITFVSGNPSWLSISGGNLVADGTQTDSSDFSGLILRVTRSGSGSDDTDSLTVTVFAAAATGGSRVLLSEWKDGPDWTFANSYLHIRWENLGGDYLDANNVSQGSTPFASCAVISSGTPGQTRTWSIGSLISRLRVDNTAICLRITSGGGNLWFASKENGVQAGPSLSVVTNQGTFAPTLLKDFFILNGIDSENLYNTLNDRLREVILLKFDLSVIPAAATVSSATLTMTVAGAGSASPTIWGAFLLDPPLIITQPEIQLGNVEYGISNALASDGALASHSSVIAYDTFTSLSAINNGNWRWVPRNSGTWANGASFGAFTDLPSLPAAEVTMEPGVGWGTSGNSVAKLIRVVYPPTWHNTLDGSADNPLTPPNRPWCREWSVIETSPTEAYLRYVIEIDEDADVGLAQDTGINMVRMARLANVLDDISGGLNPEGGGAVFSYAPSFGGVGFRPRGNPSTHGPIFRAQVYVYDYENGFGAPGSSSDKYTLEPNICFEAGKSYTIEQYVKLNTWNGQGTPYDSIASHWNSDGIQRIWINGVRCQFRSYTTGLITNFEARKIRTHEKERILFVPWGDFFAIGPINPAGVPYHLKFGAMAVTTDKASGGVAYIGPAEKSLPTWAQSSTVNQWMDIPNTAPSLVTQPATSIAGAPAGWQTSETNAAARLDAWSGPAFRKSGSIFILGPTGGHGDYFLNWLTKFDLGANSPSASLLYSGSPWSAMWANSYFASDARGPHPTHSYWNHFFCDQRDWLMCWGVEARPTTQTPFSTLTPAPPSFEWYVNTVGQVGPAIGVFDYQSLTWLPRNTVADLNNGANATTDQNVAVHPVTGDVYYGHTWFSNTHKWDQANNRHIRFAGSPALNGYAPAAIDPIRNRLLSLAKAYSGTNRAVMDCDSGLFTTISLTGAAAATLDSMGNDEQIVWVGGPIEKFLVASRGSHFGGSTVRLFWIDPVTFETTNFTPTGTAPDDPANGVLSKFAYAPELRGVVLMNRYNQNVKYLRLW